MKVCTFQAENLCPWKLMEPQWINLFIDSKTIRSNCHSDIFLSEK